jgi:hypothetical protein
VPRYTPGASFTLCSPAGLFIWDNNAPASIGYREIDFEYSRWGNAGDPTAAQYVLEPLRPGNLPGWKVRWEASGMQQYLGSGQGSGGCNNAGQTNFNGAGVNYVTCALGELGWPPDGSDEGQKRVRNDVDFVQPPSTPQCGVPASWSGAAGTAFTT